VTPPDGGPDRPVKFVELGRVNAPCRAALGEAVARVLGSGWFILGRECEAFEREFAAWVGSPHCVGTGNGLDALGLVWKAWLAEGKLREGDAVAVPANTYIASVLSVTANRLRPVLVEPDERTFNLSVEGVRGALGSRVKAALAVHLYGQLADPRLGEFCREKGLLLLEDCAQGHGAAHGGLAAGRVGDAGAFSFYPTKNLGALGDAGCVVTADGGLAAAVRSLRNYGFGERYHCKYEGVNSRLDEMQAAVLRAKLPGLDVANRARRAAAARYRREIVNPRVRLPEVALGEESHVWHLFVVRVPDRESFRVHLAACGVETQVHYPVPPHRQECYREAFGGLEFPLTEAIHREAVSLPLHPLLEDWEIGRVVAAVNGWR
jgi:dTDP-4-amino-4,6-dideoxygalactose transaminase